MLLSGRWITAAEALSLRLVNRIFPRSNLYPEAEKMAEKIKSHSPLAIRYIKRAVTQGLDMPLPAGLELEQIWGEVLTPNSCR